MEVIYVRFGDDCRKNEVYVLPACSNCKHSSTRRGLCPFHLCALDGLARWKDYFCENFTPSETAKWLAWE